MPKNADSLNSELFDFLQSRGYSPTLLDTSGKEIPVPEEAEVFQFDFELDGENYGTATISIDGMHKLVVYFGEGIANSPKTSRDDSESWYNLLRQFKRFSQKHQLSFETKNIDRLKHDMAKREHTKKLDEGYYPMGKKASYSDNVPTTKMIIKHKRNMEEGEQRFRQIDRIFIENSIGERVLAPSTKPGLARTFARHIAEGGRPYDERWTHLEELCGEYDKMAGFVRATRNGQFNESAQQLVSEGVNHYMKLRETLHKMSGRKGYNQYFECWSPAVMEEEQDEGLGEMFMNSSLDPRIECAMPILNKLKKNLSTSPMLPQVQELEEWADSLIDMDKDAMPSDMKTDELEEQEEKIAGRYDPLDFDDMVKRVGAKAKKNPVDTTELARRLHAVMAKDKKKEVQAPDNTEIKNEGLDKDQEEAGQLGPVGGPAKQGDLVGANESVDPLTRFKKLSGL